MSTNASPTMPIFMLYETLMLTQPTSTSRTTNFQILPAGDLGEIRATSLAVTSGSMDWVEITSKCVDVDATIKFVVDDGTGAVSTFVGTTRDNFEGKIVRHLELFRPFKKKC